MGDREVPKICLFLPTWKNPPRIRTIRLPPPNIFSLPTKRKFIPPLNKHFHNPIKVSSFCCSHCYCTIFVLISYSVDTHFDFT